MENFSAYELAQQRIEQRQRRRNHTLAWLLVSAVCILLTFVAGNCALPLVMIAFVLAALSGIEWYFTSRHRTPPPSQVNQEMEWLFGEGWQDTAGMHEFSLALERIQKRRVARVKFAFHLGFFLLANAVIVGLASYNLTHFQTPGPVMVFSVPVVWLAVLLYHAVSVFPSQRRLAYREQQAGETIRRELDQMQPAKQKNEDKLKRGAYYTLGDDGELVEVDHETLEDENRDSASLADG
jgi:hypothetical protein